MAIEVNLEKYGHKKKGFNWLYSNCYTFDIIDCNINLSLIIILTTVLILL